MFGVFFLYCQTLSAVSTTKFAFVSLSLDLLMSVGILPSGTLVRKWCGLGHFGLDNKAVVTFSSL